MKVGRYKIFFKDVGNFFHCALLLYFLFVIFAVDLV